MLSRLKSVVQRIFGTTPKPDTRAIELWQRRFSQLRATYDAARTSDEFKNYWQHADSYDADSANSREVRHKLISRSRYELNNNGFADGIAQTYATDLIGVGPSLRMQTGSEGFNRLVEMSWFLWTKSIQFRRKLWCMAHAKHSDGEGIGVLRRNPRVKHPIPLDVVLYESEQCQTPYLPFNEEGYIDGRKFDEFGNPLWYDFLPAHPGATNGTLWDMDPERVPADMVLFWFKLRRPGQHRGVPEMCSTLNTGAAARRWREATLSAAERAALLTLMMQTQMSPETMETDSVAPFTDMDIAKGLMTFLPQGWTPFQAEGKFPTATHEAFNRSLISEQARPRSMPYNRAAADSSGHNFASGKLDFMPYFDSLRVDREDCNELVLDPTFEAFFNLAVMRFGWLGGNPEAISTAAKIHSWDWPELKNADEKSDATAKEIKLKSGQLFLHQVHQTDLEDEIAKAAVVYGVSEDEIRKRLLDITLPPAVSGPSEQKRDIVEAIQKIYLGVGRVVTSDEAREILNSYGASLGVPGPDELGPANPAPDAADEAVAALLQNRAALPKVNGNGAHHG